MSQRLPRPISRLRQCRRFRNGLSRAPVVKVPMPRGERALLPCPLTEAEGRCPYRGAYRCTEALRARSLEEGGTCVIERDRCEMLLRSLLRVNLEYREGEVPGVAVLRAARAACEALVFIERANAYFSMFQLGEVQEHLPVNILRYRGLGFSALLKNQEAAVAARLGELGFHVEKVWATSEGRLWAWWRASHGKPWMREGMKKADPTAA